MEYFYLRPFNPGVRWKGPGGAAGQFQAELKSFDWLPDRRRVLDHVWAPFHLAVYRKVPTIWCCRNYQVCTQLFLAVCIAAELSPADIFNSAMTNGGFEKLAEVHSQVGASPLRMFDMADTESLWSLLTTFSTQRNGNVVYCDWMPDHQESDAVAQIAEELDFLFVWPQP